MHGFGAGFSCTSYSKLNKDCKKNADAMRKAEDGNPEATLGGRMDFWLLALAMAVKVDRVYFMYGCGPAKQRSETFALETFDSLET